MAGRTNTKKPRSGGRTPRKGKHAHPGYAYAGKDYLPAKPEGQYYYVLDVPHDELARVAHHGARYVERMDQAAPPNVQGWVYVGSRLPEALQPFMCAKWTREHWFQQSINGIHPTTAPEPTYDMGIFELRQDQITKRDVITKLWESGGPDALEASATGTGKTVTALSAVKSLPNVLNVLIVAPKGALPGWYQHIRDAGDGGKRWLRTTPQSLIKLLSIPNKSRVKDSSRARELRIEHGVPLVKWDVIVVDESHLRSNPGSQQSRILDKLIAHNNAFVLNLSATPGESPAKLAYLHRGFAWATGNTVRSRLHPDEYADWCKRAGMSVRATGTGLAWDPNPNDAETLHHFLFEGDRAWAVTGSPAHWPEMDRSGVPVELTPSEMHAYNTLWDEFQGQMQLLAVRQRRAARSGDARAANRLRQEAREAQIRYRQKAGIIRAPHVADYVCDQVDAGHQVAVSFEFTNSTLMAVHEELTARGITPAHHTGNNVATREQERAAYQQGKTPVILFSTTASINLHAGDQAVDGNDVPRLTVVSDTRWRGIDALQVEGRSQRNGRKANCKYMFALGTIEERVIKVMLRKMQTLHTVTGRDADIIDDVAAEMGFNLFDED